MMVTTMTLQINAAINARMDVKFAQAGKYAQQLLTMLVQHSTQVATVILVHPL
jgi:hypothetical protein